MVEDPNLRAIEVDGNYSVAVEPFAFTLVDGADDRGKKTLRLEPRGPVQSQADAQLDAAIYELVLKHGPLTSRAIEERLKGKGERIRAGAKRLEAAGLLSRAGPRKPWIAAPRGTA